MGKSGFFSLKALRAGTHSIQFMPTYERQISPRKSLMNCPGTENAPCWSATSCSPTDYSAVPSALGGLTSGFGMGPGVPPLPWSLTNKGHSAVGGAWPCPQGRTA